MAPCSFPAKKAKLRESTTEQRNWLELPKEVTENILQRLSTMEILTSARHVCRVWRNICKDPLMWRTIDMSDFNLLRYGSYRHLGKICRHAIDQSCGRLQVLRIYHFGTDELLEYLAPDNRSSNLRCLWFISCPVITDKGLSEVAKKLPLLEELYISGSFLHGVSLEVIGQCCPLLKSLVFSGSSLTGDPLKVIGKGCPLLKSLEIRMESWHFSSECDDEVFAIAKTMPGLRHLDISGNPLTDAGLLAILDGCPLLESLELRECPHLYLSGSLGQRCREQIKDLQLRTYYSDPYYCLGGDDCECELDSENEEPRCRYLGNY